MFDVDNSVVLTAIKKVFSFRANYTIYDANENSIGNVRTVGIRHGKLMMFNSSGKKILTKQDQSKIPGLYEIISNDGNVIAKYELIEEYTDKKYFVTFRHYTFRLQFNESDFNRKLLWGFFISDISREFDINYYEDAPVSG